MRILYFGILSEIAGKQEESISYSGSLEGLKQVLSSNYSAFAQQRFQVSVNQQLVDDDAVLNEGDEIALLPPFTGG